MGGWLSEVFGDTDAGRWDGCPQIWTRIQGGGGESDVRRGSLVTLMAVMVVEVDKIEIYFLHPASVWDFHDKDDKDEDDDDGKDGRDGSERPCLAPPILAAYFEF